MSALGNVYPRAHDYRHGWTPLEGDRAKLAKAKVVTSILCKLFSLL